ncbi:unnamed protein product [Hymenolepis diminuta]|uniref:HSF_DOMAIN domain-containing protein n=1 Tax=Hymenolepis diminuta TaxID=6216 RepID=A0A0R3SF45_HYMDI|nr:unnamed protein product [Hymenolepis diminuta]
MNYLNIKTYYFLFSLSESVSRGYAEVYLPELLTSMAGGCSSELLRCITLDPKQHSSSTSGLMGGPGGAGLSSAGGGAWDFASSPASSSTSLTIRKPTVTAEFHFMERILDDPFSVCKGRSGVGSPTAHLKVRTAALTSPASSSDSSLSQTDGATVSIAESGNVLVTTNVGGDRSPYGSKEKLTSGNGQIESENSKDLTPTPRKEEKVEDIHNSLQFTYETASDVDVQIKVSRLKNPSSLYAVLTSKPKMDPPEIFWTLFHSGIPKIQRPDSFIGQIVIRKLRKTSKRFRVDSTLKPDGNEQHESRLQRSTSIRGSRLFEPAYENLRMADINAAALSARQHSSKGYRRKSSVPRVLSGLTSGGCGSANTSGGFGLLGPSSQLAGVVAGLTAASVESSEASVDPSTAAAVASALAVAAATGRSTSASAPLDRQGFVAGGSGAGGGLADSFFEGSMANLGHGEHGEPLGDTVVRYAAPAANIAGMARLLYLQNLEGSEFDAISTEGYQRIVHGDQLEKQ